MSLRFLFSVSGGYGHFHPVVPLARGLQQAGHAVAFATGAYLQPLVEASGFAFVNVGGRISADREYQQVKAHLQTMPMGLGAELFAYPRLFCGIGSRLRTPDLVAVCETWRPDMVVREGGEYGAAIAAEHLGLPHATVSFAASLKAMAIFERDAAAHLDPVRQIWGLAPDPDLTALYHYLQLSFSPPRFSMQDVAVVEGKSAVADISDRSLVVPATTHFIRPQIFDRAGGESLPNWVERLPETGRRTVYVTLGTEVNNEPGLYPDVLQTIIAGLRDEQLNVIVTLGRDKDRADFGPQPANVNIERYIPQSMLLPHCDLMVMHAGSNSLLAAVDASLPTVAVPLIADQFFNAAIAQRLQMCRVVPRDQLSPAGIGSAVREVLENPVYRRNVGQLQAEMHSLPDVHYAVDLLERVASEGELLINAELIG